MNTENRKQDHIDICLNKNVNSNIKTGLEKYRLLYNALPEIDMKEISLDTKFLGTKISLPLMISPITGGSKTSLNINRNLAKIAQEYNIPMGVGSQRVAIENPELEATFKIRDIAPNIPIFANIGAVQLNYGYGIKQIKKTIEMIKADALVFHLNPLQEAIQPEGNTDFRGLLNKIAKISSELDIPVIVKEVGHGINSNVAKRLEEAGVTCIDVSGLGGTSWAMVEGYRKDEELGKTFKDFGISLAESLNSIRENTNIEIIASGGIRNGIDIVKSLCLGANICGIARPFLQPALDSPNAIRNYLDKLIKEMKIAMFCLGVKKVSKLSKEYLFEV